MPATDTNLMDYVVTYGGPSIFMTAVFVFVLPLVYFKFARPRYARWPARLAVLLGVWCLAFGVAYGDVFLIARDAKRLCETEAGMKIYRTVEAEGFAGVSDARFWIKKGFRFVESTDPLGRIVRYEILDGEEKSLVVEKSASDIEFKVERSETTNHLVRTIHRVLTRPSGEALGELVTFSVYPGWMDRPIVGTGWTPPICDGDGLRTVGNLRYSSDDLIRLVIKPGR